MSTPQELEETNPAPLPSIILILREVEDPRVERTRKHHLSDILFISLCAVICGCESFEDMEEGNAKEDWFRQYLDLPNARTSDELGSSGVHKPPGNQRPRKTRRMGQQIPREDPHKIRCVCPGAP